MSQTKHLRSRRRIPTAVTNRLVEGAFAACLGLAALAMLVLLLWITSPYPDSGAGGALRTAAGLWLMAHGAELVRTQTLSGAPAPVGVVPLLLAVLPLALLYRVARAAEGPARATVPWLSVGYLLVAALTCWFSFGTSVRVDLLSAAVRLPAVTVATIAVGAWVTAGRPAPRSDWRRLPPWLRWTRVRTAAGATGVATAVLCGGGALLAAGALVWHGVSAAEAFPQLTDAWSGRIAVLLLCVSLAPNAAVWGAAYGLGPGFAVGAGSSVGPLAAGATPQLPHFPLFAALPGEGPGGPLTWALAAPLPLAAGLAAGWYTARVAVPVPGSGHGSTGRRGTLATVLLAAAGCGLAMALLSELAGGPLGSGALADFGPVPWLTGLAACGWTLLVAAPAALAVRWWRLRDPHLLLAAGVGCRRAGAWCASLLPSPPPPAPVEDWHATGARRTRWAAIKQASGGLVPAFEPDGPATSIPSPGSPEPDGSATAPSRRRTARHRLPPATAAPAPRTPSAPATPDEPYGAGDGRAGGRRGLTRRLFGAGRNRPRPTPETGGSRTTNATRTTAATRPDADSATEPTPSAAPESSMPASPFTPTRAERRAERRARRRAERDASAGPGATP
ncbi:DUF6350 family protein [Streptomyces sp. 549]|uniref:cell division protein PerM n=1 Tax=Streptomyces sp. 549 TaxID=3049076 RepID=UPI0024C3B2B4|nr:DUF6350 family protein [Streptomyces sp. 549]MDK1472781.1 DUF6350 family protein [Streptomyces sp. 549]